MENETNKKERASLISERVKKLATLALVAAGSLTASSPAQASVQEAGTITDRVAKVRHAVVEKAKQESSYLSEKTAAPETLLAQWGNWGNWGNWNNWPNWHNWGNWGNWANWGNWGNF
jgi:hypothetical protein